MNQIKRKAIQTKNTMKITAIAVVLCMLLCTVSPIIYDWSEDHAVDSYADETDGKYLYVSLGDSMTNGYGMRSYYPDLQLMKKMVTKS